MATRTTRKAEAKVEQRPVYHFGWASYLYFVNADAEHAEKRVREFGRKLAAADASNMTYELDWSNGIFEAAARADFMRSIVTLLGAGHSAVVIRRELERKVSSEASSRRQSSSPTSNLMGNYRLEIMAQFLRDHRNFGVPTRQQRLRDLIDGID